ncbi:MAG: HD domain-containing protein [Beijerinckiaceae bacterium]|nr:HD domain-containing protein [Beijerinckiaceae bacterium]MCZ8300337.1 HD domain-containing protein [Beijerinckiaceae bacterium]
MAALSGDPGAARSAVHHALSSIFITIYGYSVCNFINGLAVSIWAATLVPVLLGQWALRCIVAEQVSSRPTEMRPKLAFAGELSVFVAGGAVIGIVNTVFHGFPAGSGLKAMLGFVTIGIFAGVDQAFVQTRIRFEEGGMPSFSGKPRSPFAVRLGLSFSLVAALIIGVITLLVLRGIEDGTVNNAEGFRRLAIEFAFVFAIISCYVANSARGAEKLLAKAVSEQVQTLGDAREGRARRRARIGTQDEIGFVSAEINYLLDELDRAHDMTTRTNDAIMKALIGLAGARDNETGEHLQRTQRYVGSLCSQLAQHPEYSAVLTPSAIADIVSAAPLHDIGKVAVSDAILHKPGRLTPEEYEVMKTHVGHGLAVIDKVIADVGVTPYLAVARDVIAGHHEHWNGAGYPFGLKGPDIPLAGRVMALADVYDALRSERIYKPAMPHAEARKILIDGAGTQFDPQVVAAFLMVEPQFERIATKFADSGQDRAATAA